jgi:hypothetical protein
MIGHQTRIRSPYRRIAAGLRHITDEKASVNPKDFAR